LFVNTFLFHRTFWGAARRHKDVKPLSLGSLPD
jgi:hypothetical protein